LKDCCEQSLQSLKFTIYKGGRRGKPGLSSTCHKLGTLHQKPCREPHSSSDETRISQDRAVRVSSRGNRSLEAGSLSPQSQGSQAVQLVRGSPRDIGQCNFSSFLLKALGIGSHPGAVQGSSERASQTLTTLIRPRTKNPNRQRLTNNHRRWQKR
jgi:hypothetical protein